MRASSAVVLMTVRVVCSAAAVLTPRMLIAVRKRIDAMASSRCHDSPISIGPLGKCTVMPRNTSGVSAGQSTAAKRANAAPTAAIAPVWMTANSVQPYRYPKSGEIPSRR